MGAIAGLAFGDLIKRAIGVGERDDSDEYSASFWTVTGVGDWGGLGNGQATFRRRRRAWKRIQVCSVCFGLDQ